MTNDSAKIAAISNETTLDTITIPSLSNNTYYYFYIRGKGDSGVSAWAKKQIFCGTMQGDGTEANPYLIYKNLDLSRLNFNTNVKGETNLYVKFMNDVDMKNIDWSLIEGESTIMSIEGQGYTLKNLTDSTNDHWAGLIRVLPAGGILKDLMIDSADIQSGSLDYRACGFVCWNYGIIQNCGITNSFIRGTVRGVAGGIVSTNSTGIVTNCYAKNTNVDGTRWGGVVGDNESTISNCYGYNILDYGSIGTDASGTVTNPQYSGTRSNCFADSLDGLATLATQTEFASGYIARLLNNSDGGSAGSVWGQTLSGNSADETPVFLNETNAVYSVTFYDDSSVVYTNSSYTFPSSSDNSWYCIESKKTYQSDTTITLTNDIHCIKVNNNGFFEIPDLATLIKFRDYVNAGATQLNAKLTANISLNGIDCWLPIGTATNAYKGIFDGQGYSISNITILDTLSTSEQGLFGNTNSATIQNIKLTDVTITSAQTSVGALIGKALNTTVSNTSLDNATLSSTSSQTGSMGGIVGYVSNGSITESSVSNTNISGSSKTSLGFIVGYFYGHGNIQNCHTTINDTIVLKDALSASAGGITGKIEGTTEDSVTVENCTNHATLYGTEQIGGIIGRAEEGNIRIAFCRNKGSIFSLTYSGGIVGWSEAQIDSCYNNGVITGDLYVGGIAGAQYGKSITNCLSENTSIGNKNILECKYILTPEDGTSDDSYLEISKNRSEGVGGIVGLCDELDNVGSTIDNCVSRNQVISGNRGIGGIAGGSYDGVLITNSYNTSTIESLGAGAAGGVIGYGISTSIQNCYNTGKVFVSGTYKEEFGIGGILGYSQDSLEVLVSCYNIGSIGDFSKRGPIIGETPKDDVSLCYYPLSYGALSATNSNPTGKEMESFKNGEVCYLLNGDQSNINFYQSIGTDTIPTFESTSKQVYRVQFVINDSIVGVSYYNAGNTIVLIEAETHPGYAFSWDIDEGTKMPIGDLIVTGIFTPNNYTVTFSLSEDRTNTISYHYGEKVSLPTTPDKDGYTFSKWVCQDDNTKDFNFTDSIVKSDITIIALWDIIPAEKPIIAQTTYSYTITTTSSKILEIPVSIGGDADKHTLSYEWQLDGETISNEASYTVLNKKLGTYNYTFKAYATRTDNQDVDSTEASIAVTVIRTDNTLSISCDDITYGNTPSPQIIENVSGTEVSYMYREVSEETFSETVPTIVGNYVVQATSAISEKYNVATATATFAINKAVITYTLPELTANYNDTLLNISIPSNEKYTIEFAEGTKTTTVGNVGVNKFAVTIIPTDNSNYSVATDSISITVNKINPSHNFIVVDGNTLSYRFSLSGKENNNISTIELEKGFSWEDSTITIAEGTQSTKLTYTPDDTLNYNILTDINVSVTGTNKQTPILYSSIGTNVTKTFGDPDFKLTIITASGDQETLKYNSDNSDILSIDEATGIIQIKKIGNATITITSDETETFSKCILVVYVTVNQAVPTYNTPENLSATFGQILADVNFSTAENGTFYWKNKQTSVGNAGTTLHSASFLPNDANYKTIDNLYVPVFVEKAESTLQIECPSKTYNKEIPAPRITTNKSGGLVTYLYKEKDSDADFSTVAPTNVGTYLIKGISASTDNYKSTESNTVTFSITKATQTYSLPTGLSSVYGNQLNTIPLPDNFIWNDESAIIENLGYYQYNATYIPDDTLNYTSDNVLITVYAGKATPDISGIDLTATATYNQVLSEITLPTGFSWKNLSTAYATKVGDVGVNHFDIVYNNENENYKTINTSIAITVQKAIPAYTIPSKRTATFGDMLGTIALPSATNGVFEWMSGNNLVGNVGTHTHYVQFIPSESTNYTTIDSIAVMVEVLQDTPILSTITTQTAFYGDSLKTIQLPQGYTWVNITSLVGNVGTKSFQVLYTPTDTVNYKKTYTNVFVKVEQAVPDYKTEEINLALKSLEATYGQTLAKVELPQFDSGKFSWEADESTNVGNTGTNVFYATYTPSDKNYQTISSIPITVVVNKAIPQYTTPINLTATFGDMLATVIIPIALNGSYSWLNVTDTVGFVGSRKHFAKFIPNESTNYTTVDSIPLTVIVEKAIPSYTLPMTLTAVYGDSLQTIALPSGFVWTNTDTTITEIGSEMFESSFVPDDTINYEKVNGLMLTVKSEKATPSVILPSSLEATYGQTLAEIEIPETTNGTFAWTANLTSTVGTVGINSFFATFTPFDTEHYNIISFLSLPVSVKKATPSYETPTNIEAVYGQKLSEISLPKGFAWNSPTDSVGCVGNQTHKVSYTPTDITNYASVEDISIDVLVVKATPTYNSDSLSEITALYGQTLSNIVLPVGFTWDSDSTTILQELGTQNFLVSYQNADTANYNIVHGINVNVTVNLSYKTPQISLVTVSQESGKNLIVWLKEKTDSIEYYTIYRETEIAGEYAAIAQVPYNELSVYEDVYANPQERSWRYTISATGYSGLKTEQSAPHKSLHLQKNIGLDGSINLYWTEYEGIDFSTYVILRSTEINNETTIDTLTSLASTENTYTDLARPTEGKIAYFVGIVLPETIDPKTQYLKAESGPFSLAMSNIAEAENDATAIPVNTKNKFKAFAVQKNIKVSGLNEQEMVSLYNVNGKLISKITSSNTECIFTVNLAGVYFVKTNSEIQKVIVK